VTLFWRNLMIAAGSTTLTAADAPASSRSLSIAYWAVTLFVAGTSAASGAMDILRTEPLFGVLLHLGYPAYFATLLGTWKVLGAIALLAPRSTRLKEWAYAGFFFDDTAAFVSHAAVGDGVAQLAGPLVSLGFLVASWWLRPASRRLATMPRG
jgi:hypothetical protein